MFVQVHGSKEAFFKLCTTRTLDKQLMGKKKGKGGGKPVQAEDEIPDYLLAEQDLLEVVHEESDSQNTEDVNSTGNNNKNAENNNNSQNNSQSSTGTNKETKGQMLQRHKKEVKVWLLFYLIHMCIQFDPNPSQDLKQQTQEMLHHQEKLDKKSKQQLMDTIKKMEDDLKVKHEKELQTVEDDEVAQVCFIFMCSNI